MKITTLLAAIFAFAFAGIASAQDYDYYRVPPGSPRPGIGRVELERLRVFIPPAQFERGLDVERMEDFCGDIAKTVSDTVSETTGAFELVVRVTLSKEDKPECEVSSKDKVADAMLQTIRDHLQVLPGMHSKVGSLPFELHYTVKLKA